MHEVLVIGGGVTGLFTAKELLDRGLRDIVIVEKNYIGSGGTFRCATGIRASFTSREHAVVMKRSIELWPRWANELGFLYRRDGYLWVLRREEDLNVFRKIVEFHHTLDIPTRILSPDEVRELVPAMKVDGVLAAVHDPLAGKAEVFRAMINTMKYLRENGVKIIDGTAVHRLVPRGNEIAGAVTDKGVIEARSFLVAAGSGAKAILETAGVSLPIHDLPKHVLITEAYKPVIKPLIIDWATSSYILQVFHGNIYIGADIPEKYDTPAVNRFEFLRKAARVWTKFFPWLREVHVLRYWTGYYDMTPDHHPIIGPVEKYENLFVAAGFSGHGFMMAPAVAEALADYITGRKPGIAEFANLTPGRFERGELIKEIAVFG